MSNYDNYMFNRQLTVNGEQEPLRITRHTVLMALYMAFNGE